jgi:outer membrane biosynthesis protein TonB
VLSVRVHLFFLEFSRDALSSAFAAVKQVPRAHTHARMHSHDIWESWLQEAKEAKEALKKAEKERKEKEKKAKEEGKEPKKPRNGSKDATKKEEPAPPKEQTAPPPVEPTAQPAIVVDDDENSDGDIDL